MSIKAILTTGVVYLRNLVAGQSTATALGPAMSLVIDLTVTPTVTNTLTTLISYTLPANVMVNNGDMLEIEAETVHTADNVSRSTSLIFGGTVVASRSGVNDNSLRRFHRAIIVRKTATTQLGFGWVGATGDFASALTDSSPAETLTGAVTITFKGQNATDSTAAVISSRYLRITYWPVGTYVP